MQIFSKGFIFFQWCSLLLDAHYISFIIKSFVTSTGGSYRFITISFL